VSDWNRLGLDGKPRPLHIANSMRSIRFDDFAPAPEIPMGETLVYNEFFRVEKWSLTEARPPNPDSRFAICTVLAGRLNCARAEFRAGDFFLVPPTLAEAELVPREPGTELLRTTLPV
jgi:mannose-6-phosphate isomerase